MKTKTITTGAVLLLLASLTACTGADAGPKAPAVEAVAPTTPEVKEEPPRSERGNFIKKIGEAAGMAPENADENFVDFAVTGITVDAPCTAEYTQPPARGHFIRVDMEIATTAAFTDQLFVGTNGVWKWIDANGTTANGDPATGNGYSCLTDLERLPDVVGTAERVTGSVVLDVPTTEGILVFAPSSGLGWEWVVPAL